MRINDFFDFGSKFLSSTIRARSVGLKPGNNLDDIGDANRLLTGDYESIPFPIIFRQDQGTEFQDVLDTGRAFLFLISDRMKSVLEKNDLTGWKCFPICLLDKNENEIKGYQGLSVTGRCGPIDFAKSDVFYKRLVPKGPLFKYFKGRHVGLDKWDGSDFFLPEGSYSTIVTMKVADIVRSYKLTNVLLRNLSEIEIPEEATVVTK